jgi:hypothetical protein
MVGATETSAIAPHAAMTQDLTLIRRRLTPVTS